jgi:hypothetical protein
LIANAEARRNELRARFFGTQSKKTWWTAHLEVTPEEGTSLSKFKLLEYDREAGACNLPSPQTGVNVRLVTDPPKYADCGDQARKQTVLASVTKDGGDFAEKAGAHFAAGITPEARYGLFYRVPSQATVRLYERPATATVSDSFARTRVSIAQYGKVVALPESTGGRNTKYTATFDPQTGFIPNLVVTSAAVLQASQIKEVGDTVAGVVTDVRSRRAANREEAEAAAEEAAGQTAAELERTKKELELRVAIEKARRELEGYGVVGADDTAAANDPAQ